MIFVSFAFAGEATEPPPMALEIKPALEAVRGHPFDLVPFQALSEGEAVDYYRRLLLRTMSEEEVRRMGLSMEVLDLLPGERRFLDLLMSFLESGLYGFYDPINRRFVVVQRPDLASVERQVFSHELVHVLQDDAFSLELMYTTGLGNGDVVAAMQCLVEGDATYTELLLSRGETLEGVDLRAMIPGVWPESEVVPTSASSPGALVEQTSLNYTMGAQLVAHLRAGVSDWSRVDAMYKAPPLSTEQVLHPERLSGPLRDRPMIVSLSRSAFEGVVPGYAPVATDSIGELSLLTMFRAWGLPEKAPALCDGWDGDRMVILEDERQRWLLVWRTVWDSEPDALAFQEAIEAQWRGEAGFSAERRGSSVVILRQAPSAQQALLREIAWRAPVKEARRIEQLVDRRALRRGRK